LAAWLLTDSGGDGEGDSAPDVIDYGQQALAYGTEIFDRVDNVTAQQNQLAFLAALRAGEGTAGGDYGYRMLYGSSQGGSSLFDSYADHPAMLGWPGVPLPDGMCAAAGFDPGCVSTAAGAYQINRPTWKRLKQRLGLSDFSPASQDACALELISEKGALSDVRAGRVADAVAKVRKVWASLPGAGYGQGEVALAAFTNRFTQAGGSIA
jgi:lysozyme